MKPDEMTPATEAAPVPASDPMPAFMAAFSAYQAELEVINKSKSANAGKYKYTYATYADIARVVLPIMGRHGLSFTCMSSVVDRTIILTGRVMHEAGGYIEGSMPIRWGTPQEIGGDLTYMQRYLIKTLAGVATDDEDDEVMRDMPRQQRQSRAPQQPVARPASPATIAAATELAQTAGYAPQMLVKLVDWVTQGRTTVLAEMTEDEAAVFIDKTRQKLQEQAPAGEQTELQVGNDA